MVAGVVAAYAQLRFTCVTTEELDGPEELDMTTMALLDTRTLLLELTGAVMLDFATELDRVIITGVDEEAPVAFDNTAELDNTTVLDNMTVLDNTLALDISEALEVPSATELEITFELEAPDSASLDSPTADLSTQFRSIESGS